MTQLGQLYGHIIYLGFPLNYICERQREFLCQEEKCQHKTICATKV